MAPASGDDDFRAMLLARADQMPATAGRDVLAAARAELRTPRNATGIGTGFAVLPVLTGRGVGGSSGWIVAALVAALVIAVAGIRPFGSSSTSVGPTVPPSAPVSSGASSAPAPSALPAAAGSLLEGSGSITLAAMRAGIASGALAGRIAVLTDTLDETFIACALQASPAPSGGCRGYAFASLPGVSVSWGDGTTPEGGAGDWVIVAWTAHARTANGSVTVLGRLHGDPAVVSPTALAATPASSDPLAISAVGGWLTVREPARSCVGDTGCSGQGDLTADDPATAGTAGAVFVNLALSSPAIPTRPGVVRGPFLVRGIDFGCTAGAAVSCPYPSGPLYTVVAGYDPAGLIRVVAGSEASSSAAPGGSLSIQAMRAGIADGSLDGRVVVLHDTLEAHTIFCTMIPAGATPPPLCSGFRFGALPNIGVTWKPLSTGTGLNDWVVVPSSGSLQVLGRLHGDLASPIAPADLLVPWPGVGDEVVPVEGFLGVTVDVVSCPSATVCTNPGTLWPSDPATAPADQVRVGVSVVQSVVAMVTVPASGTWDTLPTSGTWLVRLPGTGITVEARIDSSTVIRVQGGS